MTQLDDRVREAFSSIEVPDDVKARTLDAIARMSEEAAGAEGKAPHADRGVRVVASKRSASKPRQRRRLAFALAACLSLAAVGGGGAFAYASETASVYIDSPSLGAASDVVFGVNRFNIVVSATADDEKTQELLDALNVRGMSYDEAFSTLLARIDEQAGEMKLDVSVQSAGELQGNALRERTMACMHEGGVNATYEDGVCRGHKGEGGSSANASDAIGQGRGAADGSCPDGASCDDPSCEERRADGRGRGCKGGGGR